MKYCSQHHNNPDDAVYCSECGEKLPAKNENVCSICNAPNPKEAEYCHSCGKSLKKTTPNREQKTSNTTTKKINQQSNTHSGNQRSNISFKTYYKIAEIALGKTCMLAFAAIIAASVYAITIGDNYLIEFGGYEGDCYALITFSLIAILCTFNVIKTLKRIWVIVWKIVVPLELLALYGCSSNLELIYGYEFSDLYYVCVGILIVGYIIVINRTKDNPYIN